MTQIGAELSSSDLRQALTFAGDLAVCRTAAEMDRQVRLLPTLVGSEALLIGKVRRPAVGSAEPATLVAVDDPPGFFDEQARAAFMRLWHQQPVVVHHFRGFAPRAMKVSDFLSDRQWRRSEIYSDCYGGRLGLTWEIAAQIRFSPEEQACAALQRADRDFTERDRSLLDAVSPHLRAGYARLEAEAGRERRLALLERGLERRGDAALLVDRGGRILTAGSRARLMLHEWFGIPPAPSALPAEVEGWRSSRRGPAATPVLDFQRSDRRLRLRLVAGPMEDAILLSERRDGPLDPELLARALPLSRRESQVLALLAQGQMNAAIAHQLGISPKTVSRHLERVYSKLGVQNRAAATAAARDALDI
jgi:DNA-binding CsgD family transcriptional regulator